MKVKNNESSTPCIIKDAGQCPFTKIALEFSAGRQVFDLFAKLVA